MDIFPSICALTGATPPAGVGFDGEDASHAFLGHRFSRTKPLFWEYGRNTKWFKFPETPRDRSPNLAVRDGHWKLLVNADGSRSELYDVVADELESREVSAEHPELTKRLTRAVLDWRKAVP